MATFESKKKNYGRNSRRGRGRRERESRDSDFRDMIRYPKEGVLPTEENEARKIAITADQYDIVGGRLYHLHHIRKIGTEKVNPVQNQLCAPRVFREQILDRYHTENCHIGFDRLYASLRQKYYWLRMYSQLHELVLGCQDC